MYANASLVEKFDRLIAPLVTSGLDLPTCIERIEGSVQSSVRSLLGWSLGIRVDGAQVTMTCIPRGTVAADVRASLRIPLSGFLAAGPEGGMVFYASEPHAFRRFAQDFSPVAGGPTRCLIRTDQDLNPSCTAGLGGVHLMSSITRAISVLVSRGYTADAARMCLQAAALAGHLTLTQSARALLTDSIGPRIATTGLRVGFA